MKKLAFLITVLFSNNALSDYISGDMTLRDAIYVYDMQVNAKGSKGLFGVDCDVMQVVFDLDSGYTNILYGQGDTVDEFTNSMTIYKDSILDDHKMFSYALYKDKSIKGFQFGDKVAVTGQIIGSGTFFAYCYSTKPDAYVYLYEGDKCQIKYSDGSTDQAVCH